MNRRGFIGGVIAALAAACGLSRAAPAPEPVWCSSSERHVGNQLREDGTVARFYRGELKMPGCSLEQVLAELQKCTKPHPGCRREQLKVCVLKDGVVRWQSTEVEVIRS